MAAIGYQAISSVESVGAHSVWYGCHSESA
jgi:hypothetical protein